jgi:RNA polymerase sigma factor (sigma-70 family)
MPGRARAVTSPRRAVYESAVVGRPLEDELLDRARKGDADAYGALVEMHQEIAFRIAYAVLGDAAEAEDATQDGLVKAYRALGRLVKAYRALGRIRRGSPFRPWLLRIVGNEARNRARGRRERLARLAAAEDVSGGAAPPPETEVLESERREELFSAIARLGPDERLALVGRFFLGLTDAEAAAALGVRRGAVKMRVFRALERLRVELEGGR